MMISYHRRSSMKHIPGLLIILFLILGVTTSVFATTEQPSTAPSCQPIFGGGEYTCSNQKKITQSPTPANKISKQTTKGGLTVEKQSNATKTPATGPESLAILILIPAAGMGIWLRKKIK